MHKNEIAELNQKLDELKQDFIEQIKIFESVYKKFEKDKITLVDDLKLNHRLEIEKLEEKYAANKDILGSERAKLEENYKVEINRVKAELEEIASKAGKEKQEYEQNLNKLKSFHERELEACKQNSTNEYVKLIDVLKANIESMKKQKLLDENEFNSKYNKKLKEIVILEEEIKSLNEMISNIKNSLMTSNNDLSFYNQKVSSFK